MRREGLHFEEWVEEVSSETMPRGNHAEEEDVVEVLRLRYPGRFESLEVESS